MSANREVRPDLTTRVGLIEHRIEAIRMALVAAVSDDVRVVLNEHLMVAEAALDVARRAESLSTFEHDGLTIGRDLHPAVQ